MQHTTKAATVTAIELGEFVAVAAAYSVDRVRDQIVPGAFKNTIERWRASGKRIPLHWNHQGEASNIIGYIEPASMRETSEGLRVSGKLDLDTSDVAREAWRSMKHNSMSLSFGYAVTRQRKRSDGINELHELDLFEISIVPAPANSDTRVLEMKSIDDDEDREVPSLEELRHRERQLGLNPDFEALKRQMRDEMLATLKHGNGKLLHDELREKADRIAAEFAPVTIATFDA